MKKLPSLDLFQWLLMHDHQLRMQKIRTPKGHFQDHHHHPLFPQEQYPTKLTNAYVMFHIELSHEIKMILIITI